MRARVLRVLAVTLAAGIAAGCTVDDPDPDPPATTGPGGGAAPTATGPARVQADPVPDCAEVISLIPPDVATQVAVDPAAASPSASDSPDGYLTTCVIAGRSAVDPRLRLFLQLRLERPRTDPYKLTPLARWFDDNARTWAGQNCSPVTAWTGLDNGYRCGTENGPNVTVLLAGRAAGALVWTQTVLRPLEGQAGVTADAVRTAATTTGERITSAVAGSL